MLATAHIVLNSARTASLVLLWCVLTGLVLLMPVLRRQLRALLVPATVVVVVAVLLSYPILQQFTEFTDVLTGTGDDALSVLSRSQSNALLLEKLRNDLWLGLGAYRVTHTTAYGYMSHTLYANALAAYGAIGFLVPGILVALGLFFTQRAQKEAFSHFLFLAILISSFSNNVFAYFGMAIALIEVMQSPPPLKGLNHEPQTTPPVL